MKNIRVFFVLVILAISTICVSSLDTASGAGPLTLTTNTPAVGRSVAISGSGYSANAPLTIKYDGIAIGTLTATSLGGIPSGSTFVVPAWTSVGVATQVQVSDGTNTGSNTFTAINIVAIDGQQIVQDSSSTTSTTLTISTTQLNDIIYACLFTADTETTLGISDTAGLTWIPRASYSHGLDGGKMQTWYAKSQGKLTNDIITFTTGVTPTPVGRIAIAFAVCQANFNNPFDNTNPPISHSKAYSSQVPITTTHTSMIVALVGVAGDNNIPQRGDIGWGGTWLVNSAGGTGYSGGVEAAQNVAAGTKNCPFYWSNNVNYISTAEAFLPRSIPQSITVTSNPIGSEYISVDGTPMTTPKTFTWFQDSGHALAAQSPISAGTNVQHVFNTWSDSGSQTHIITVPSSTTTYTATYNTQYKVTFDASTNVKSDGSDTIVTVAGSAKTAEELPFTEWINSGSSLTYDFSSPVTSTSSPTDTRYAWTTTNGLTQTSQESTFTVNSAGTITGTYINQFKVTYAATENALPVNVPDQWVNSGNPATNLFPGAFPNPLNNSPDGNIEHATILCSFMRDDRDTPSNPNVITAPRTVYGLYQSVAMVQSAANPSEGGTTNFEPYSGFIIGSSGSSSNVMTAIPNAGYRFVSWASTDGITINDPASSTTTATVNNPGTITANFELIVAEVQSSDSETTNKNEFTPIDTVYAYGSGYASEADLKIYIVIHRSTWTAGDSLTDVREAPTFASASSSGILSITELWANPSPGIYDIVVDVNQNGEYDAGDAIDNVDVTPGGAGGFLVVPEYLFGGLAALGACFVGFAVFKKLKSTPQLR